VVLCLSVLPPACGSVPDERWSLGRVSLLLFNGSLFLGRLCLAAALRRVFRANALPPLCFRGFSESLWLCPRLVGDQCVLFTIMFVSSTTFSSCYAFVVSPCLFVLPVVFKFPMLTRTLSFLSWNVRGLGQSCRCDEVLVELILQRPSVVAIQETKLQARAV
jgi:hypothetical protein